MTRSSTTQTVLRARGLCKRFGGTPILVDVDLDVMKNEVIGIVGENGAGKTTLFNILSGVLPADAGEMSLHESAFRPRDYRQANDAGVFRVFQEQALIPNIRVYENLLLSREGSYTRFGQLVDTRAMINAAQRVMDEANLDIDVRRVTDSYSFSKRQLIEIARACVVPTEILGMRDPVVLLDEPTSALERSDEATFRDLVQRLRERASIVFVSHRLSEVLELSDMIYVLKDGAVVERKPSQALSERQLHGLMVGRERDADYYHEGRQFQQQAPSSAFTVRDLSGDGYHDVSMSVAHGEIVGIGGLMNSGKSELGKGVAGIRRPVRGMVSVGDGGFMSPDVRRLTRQGVGYVPAERLREGMIPGFQAAWNLSLAGGMDKFATRAGFWRRRREHDVTQEYIDSMPIKAPGPRAPCSNLSGGNQQKIVLARWLCRAPGFLVLDNPTRGVDAGAKEEIYKILRDLCEQGVGILLITDDLLELIGLSNRIIIMQHGRIMAEIEAPARSKPTERDLVAAMLTSEPETRDKGSVTERGRTGVTQ